MPRALKLEGQRFARLLVLSRAGHDGGGRATWSCVCDCGGQKVVRSSDLTRGRVRSCGCLQIENSYTSNLRHGHSRKGKFSPTYISWFGMRCRCETPTSGNYYKYGARGIKVCRRWRGPDGFVNFIADMGERPAGMTLDRFQNGDGDYKPGNCRWATIVEQNNNRRFKIRSN